MAFDDMPEMPRMLLPGAHEYAARILASSKQVAETCRTVMDVSYGRDYWQKVDFYLPHEESLTEAVLARGLPVMCFIHGGAFRNGFSSPLTKSVMADSI